METTQHIVIGRWPDLPHAPAALIEVCRKISPRGHVVHNGARVVWTVDAADNRANGKPSLCSTLTMNVDTSGQWTGSLDGQPTCYLDNEGDLRKAASVLLRDEDVCHLAPVEARAAG